MFNSKKLQQFAYTIHPYLSDEMSIEISEGIDSYGIDSGAKLLVFYIRYFKKEFLRQFYDGNEYDFHKSYRHYHKLAEIPKI